MAPKLVTSADANDVDDKCISNIYLCLAKYSTPYEYVYILVSKLFTNIFNFYFLSFLYIDVSISNLV